MHSLPLALLHHPTYAFFFKLHFNNSCVSIIYSFTNNNPIPFAFKSLDYNAVNRFEIKEGLQDGLCSIYPGIWRSF